MFDRCVPVALNGLARARHLVALADAAGDPVIFQHQLASGVFGFSDQIRIVCSMAHRLCFPVAGKPVPEMAEAITIFDHIDQTEVAILTLTADDFSGAEQRIISHVAGFAELEQTATDYVDQFAVPNLWFHVTMAYAALRTQGLDLGKADFDGLHDYPTGFSWLAD